MSRWVGAVDPRLTLWLCIGGRRQVGRFFRAGSSPAEWASLFSAEQPLLTSSCSFEFAPTLLALPCAHIHRDCAMPSSARARQLGHRLRPTPHIPLDAGYPTLTHIRAAGRHQTKSVPQQLKTGVGDNLPLLPTVDAQPHRVALVFHARHLSLPLPPPPPARS